MVSVAHHPLTLEIADVRNPRDIPPLPGDQVDAHEPTQITVKTAQEVFEFLKDESNIPFSFIRDCCKARAQKMCRLMWEKEQISSQKIWNYGHGYFFHNCTATLFVKVPPSVDPSEQILWKFHVAPIVRVVDGPHAELVIDPSLFDRAVPLEEWIGGQNDKHARQEHSKYWIYANEPNSFDDCFDPGPEKIDEYLAGHRGEHIYVKRLREILFRFDSFKPFNLKGER